MNDIEAKSNAIAAANSPKASDTVLASFIWKNAEDLWGDFKHTGFGKIILPFTLLRRLECVLEPTRDKVREAHDKFKDKGLDTGSGAVQSAVVRALQSHGDLAAHVMKHDQQAMVPLIGLVYELVKAGHNIDLNESR